MSFATVETPGRARRHSGDRTVVNDRLAVWLVFLVALSPVVIGGNMPIVWLAYAFAVALTTAGYMLILMQRGATAAVPLEKIPDLVVPWAILCAFILGQSLSAGALTSTMFHLPGGDLAAPSLSLAPGQSRLVLLQFVSYGLFFVLFLQIGAKSRRSDQIVRALFWTVVLFAMHGLIVWWAAGEAVLRDQSGAVLEPATSTFVNRNSYATFLSLGLVTGIAMLTARIEMLASESHHGLHWPARLLPTMIGTAFILAALLATQSRMGLFAGLVGALAVIALWTIKSRGSRLVPALLLAGVIIAGMVVLYGAGLVDRVGSVEQAFDVRWDLYGQIAEMIGARPWLGYGAGAFEIAFPLFHRPPVSVDLVWDRAHSSYLTLWSELGVVVGSLPILIIALVLWRLLATFAARAKLSAANVAAIGAIAVVAIHSLVDFSLEIHAVALLFTALIAIGLAVGYQRSSARHHGAA